MTTTVALTPHHVAELYRVAFAQVHDPEDWKAPIDCMVPWELANLYMQAIEFMTGVKPEAVKYDTMYQLTCCGYRNGPCGG